MNTLLIMSASWRLILFSLAFILCVSPLSSLEFVSCKTPRARK